MIRVPTDPSAHIVFDILAWISAAALGAAVRQCRLYGTIAQVANHVGPGYAGAIVAGALPGAWLAGSFNTLHEAAATLSHSIAGALAGAIIAVEIYKLRFGIRLPTGAMFVAPFAAGVAIGRWGCLFAGLPDDTHGTPTTLPWGVDLGDGIPRHPVQIYESLSMAVFLAVFLLALGFRRRWPVSKGFYVMAGWYGAQRFGWEFLKPYPPVFGPLNVFHLICLGLMIYAITFYLRSANAAAP